MRRLISLQLLVLLSVSCAGSSHRSMAIDREVVPIPGHPGVGPYSHAIRAGHLLFVSGQPGLNPATGALAGPGFEAQARQALANLVHVLRTAGSGPEHVVQTTVWLTDTTNFSLLNRLYAEVFSSSPPTRSTPTVQLPRGILISIDAIAIAPGRSPR
jgi:2-iminobutanoate/2-iminopropanoate deaminase